MWDGVVLPPSLHENDSVQLTDPDENERVQQTDPGENESVGWSLILQKMCMTVMWMTL